MSIIKGTNQIVAGFGGTKRSIGEVYFSQSALATDNSGALPLFTGETIASANTIYPEFYNWVLSHTELQCSSAEYEASLTTYGECPKYVVINSTPTRYKWENPTTGVLYTLSRNPAVGDLAYDVTGNSSWPITEASSTEIVVPTFVDNKPLSYVEEVAGTSASIRLPKLSNYIKAANTAEGIKNIEAGLPNITGYTGFGESNNLQDGAFGKRTESKRYTYGSGFSTSANAIYFDASRSSDKYGKSSTVTPASTTLYPWVVAYTAAIPASTAQAAEFQQGLSGKVDLADGVTNDNVDYVVDSYNDANGNWYRVYKSGWLEQGGFFGTATGDWASVTFTYLKPFQNTNYQLFCLGNWNSPASSSCRVTAKSTTSATVTYANNTTNDQLSVWRACGQGTAPTGTGEVFSSTLNTSQTPVLLHLDGNNTNSGTAGLSWVGNSFTFVSEGKFGQCAKLSGYYDFRGLNFSETDKYTVEYWAGASEDNAGTYFTWGTGSGPSAILSIAINHGKNEFIIKQSDNTIAYQSGLSSSVDKWHHTAFVYHGDSTFTFFIDGKKVDYTLSASGATSVYNCIFNGDSGKGLFDEFVVHNYERYTKDFKLQTTPYTLA